METSSDTSRRQARPGSWQYPGAAPGVDDDQAAADGGELARLTGPPRAAREARLGIALGWLSIGLGLAGLMAPRFMARAAGMPDWPHVMRVVGMRELVSGVGLLNRPHDQLWRWSRVMGDAMDLGIVGVAAIHPYANRRRLASTALALASVGALDLRAGNPPRITPSHGALTGPQGGQRVQHAVSIHRPAGECYRFWRDLARLPEFMQHLESVTVIDERRSHWCASGPAGRKIEWDADITDDQPGQLLRWRSVPGADVDNAGSVRFIPANGGRATVLQVQMSYHPPAGRAGAAVARLFGEEPLIQVRDDLRRFKQLIETGEIPTTRGQPAGARSLVSTLFGKGADQ
ncbi:cyclase/dehydrase [Massilia violaceinigra]|uniref:Cyclase/dehydrase n=1 Tax=Massilia violaceinigra TaxID=2045208 RepID=A0A2D2DF24_9BURK|nr:SRPBCC family protein [Massilia violaceinigra]ATQ73586.1 cyclase/dehydrase [Massilia violaceinigra]